MVSITVKDLAKKFGQVVAIDNLCLEVKDKELLVLLGPSGCGKTTALRCIAGLEKPDEGNIYIGDALVNDLPPKDRDIAMVFQSYALYPHMTVFDNLAFPLRERKFSKKEIEKKVHSTAKLLRIFHLLNRKPRHLSGGEAQRTALGRAIVREPKAFLMDEPLSNLDAKLRLYMRAELKRLQKELATTTIYVTHDQVEAMTMGKRIAVMHKGSLLQLDSPDMTYKRPKNTFVAGFVGSPPMNLIECTFMEKNGKAVLDASDFKLPITNDFTNIIKQEAQSSNLILGIRPEDVSVHKTKRSAVCFEAIVYVTEPLGSKTILDLKVGKTLIRVETRSGLKTSTNEKLHVCFNMHKIHIFDKKTSKAIV